MVACPVAGRSWEPLDQATVYENPKLPDSLSLPTTDVLVGAPFRLPVDAEDPYGNIDPTFNGSVTLTLASNPGGAKLGGTVSAKAINGIVSFSGLTLSAGGTGDTLTATSAGLATGTSATFNVTQDALVVTTEPPGA